MLRLFDRIVENVTGFFTYLPEPPLENIVSKLDSNENIVPTSSQSNPIAGKKTFSSRLQEINYDEKKIPNYFLDPIIPSIMENPVIVNQHKAHTFDEAILEQWLRTNPKKKPATDPLGTVIEIVNGEKDICLNTERKNQIELFVSTLEKIHKLQEAIISLEEIKINSLDDAIKDTNVSPTEVAPLLKEQRKALKTTILQTRKQLAAELNTFIVNTETILNSEDKSVVEKLAEIKRIIDPQRERLKLLQDEINDELNDELKQSLQLIVYQPSHHFQFQPSNQNCQQSFFANTNTINPIILFLAYVSIMLQKQTAKSIVLQEISNNRSVYRFSHQNNKE